MGLLLDQIKEHCQPGIFRLFNNSNNSCLIFYAKNISKKLINIVTTRSDLTDYKFEVLEYSNCDLIDLKIKTQYWKDKYSNLGCLVSNPLPKFKRRVIIDLLDHFNKPDGKELLCYVKIVSRGSKDLILGIYNSYGDAQEFINKYYKEGIKEIVYAENELTNEYYRLFNDIK